MRTHDDFTLWDRVTPVAVTSSTDATPIVVTATSHGRSNGDFVMIFGHTTNIAANGIFKIGGVTANTFTLLDRNTGASVAGSGAGAGASGVLMPSPASNAAKYIMDYKSVTFQVSTESTSTLTCKFIASQGQPQSAKVRGYGDIPNMGASQSATNPWAYVAITNTANGATLPGATGIVVAGTDVQANYEAYLQGMKYIVPVVISWTQGAITLKMQGYYF